MTEVAASDRVAPLEARRKERVIAALICVLIRALSVTIRFQLDDRSELFAGEEPKEKLIFCVWHNRLALVLVAYRRHVTRFAPQRRMAGMVSASRDGAMMARVLELFGVQPVRGSSSRRGSQALRELVGWAEQGYDIAITPDGPRGPCYAVQEGVIRAAQLSGLMIVPASYYLSPKIRLKSWDGFQVPLPFSRCEFVVGRPMRVPPDATDADREALRHQLEAEMRAITKD